MDPDTRQTVICIILLILAVPIFYGLFHLWSAAGGYDNLLHPEETVEVSSEPDTVSEQPETEASVSFVSITMDEAKEIFAVPGDYLILDVRRADEFAQGHIPGAVNIANEDILDTPPAGLPDRDQVIYVYCRSGNRSRQASLKLAAMGYTHIIEFGGIIDWTGDIVTE